MSVVVGMNYIRHSRVYHSHYNMSEGLLVLIR